MNLIAQRPVAWLKQSWIDCCEANKQPVISCVDKIIKSYCVREICVYIVHISNQLNCLTNHSGRFGRRLANRFVLCLSRAPSLTIAHCQFNYNLMSDNERTYGSSFDSIYKWCLSVLSTKWERSSNGKELSCKLSDFLVCFSALTLNREKPFDCDAFPKLTDTGSSLSWMSARKYGIEPWMGSFMIDLIADFSN